MKYSKGICWIGDCRIPFVDENTSRKQTPVSVEVYGWSNHKGLIGSFDDSAKQGRFTPNLLVCDDMLNDGNIGGGGKHSGVIKRKRKGYKLNPNSDNLHSTSPDNYGDKGTNSRYYDLDKWFDKIIDSL
jgi:hypothetical protein